MADVRPLRGVRFDPRRSGPVGPLLAPPYDVANTPASGAAFSTGAAFSIGEVEYVDLGLPGDQHAIAAARYRSWRAEGALRRDDAPAIYLHEHQFDANGASRTRTGLLARVRLADWSERVVLPHERTTPGPRAERLERLRAVGVNLSPLYFLFRDPAGTVQDLMRTLLEGQHGSTERDRMGGAHRLAAVTDPAIHERLAHMFADRTLFVADGHHRYEAALAYRNECRERDGYDENAPHEFVLALLAAVDDPGVIVRPTHRLLNPNRTLPPESLLALARRWFRVESANGPAPATDEDGFGFRLVLPAQGGTWDVRALPNRAHTVLLPRQRGDAWRSLPVAAVQGLLESGLGANGESVVNQVTPAIDEAVALRRVETGAAQATFLLPAPDLDRVLAVAEEGDLLPPKSTWFEPKAPAGLVINELTE